MRTTFFLVLLVASLSEMVGQQGYKDTATFSQILDEAMALKASDSLRSDSLAKIAIDKALEQSNQQQIAESRLNYGRILLHHLAIDSALVQLNAALDLFEPETVDTTLANIYIELGKAWYHRRTYGLATQYNFQALRIYEALDMQQERAQRLARIGLLLIFQESYDEGVAYCQQALTLQEELGELEDMGTTYLNMSRGYLFTPNLDEAVASANKAIEMYQAAGSDSTLLAGAYNTRGNVFKYLERYEDAEADYRRNLAFYQRQNDLIGMATSHGNLGHALRLQGKYEEALSHNLRSIELNMETGDIRNLWENYLHVSIEYEMLGNYKKSLEYNILFSEERERLNEEAQNHLKSELQIQYETDKKNATIAGQEAQIAQQRRIKELSIGIGVLLLIVAAVIYFFYRKNRRITQQLAKRNQENELLLKEIHHRVKNNLQVISSLLSLQSAQVQDETVLEAMRESRNRVRSMALIHQKLYQGENLAGVEMKDYFETLSKGILSSFGVKQDKVKIVTPMEELELDVDHAIPVGLIVNELLTNAMKYAFPDQQKGEIQISLEKDDQDELRLVVADSGKGLEENTAPEGTGFGSQLVQLLTMQLNGKLEVKNEDGMKTILRFKTNKAA